MLMTLSLRRYIYIYIFGAFYNIHGILENLDLMFHLLFRSLFTRMVQGGFTLDEPGRVKRFFSFPFARFASFEIGSLVDISLSAGLLRI